MVRNYSDEPVPAEVIDRIVRTARKGPSAGFSQGQSFVAVTESEMRKKIAEAAGEQQYVERGMHPWISRAPVIVVLCTSERIYRDRYGEADKRAVTRPEWPVPWWYLDAGCSLMLLLLGAVNEGLAAGFCGVRDPTALKELLGIPGHVEPIGLVTIGLPAPDRKSGSLERGWKPIDEVVHWEHWGRAR